VAEFHRKSLSTDVIDQGEKFSIFYSGVRVCSGPDLSGGFGFGFCLAGCHLLIQSESHEQRTKAETTDVFAQFARGIYGSAHSVLHPNKLQVAEDKMGASGSTREGDRVPDNRDEEVGLGI
jgi:hypothetical protein